ncbi:MAG: hypothetical protein Q8R92_02785 [Deltaproteobacteria bacterium]|nr:hypothetical protein [Deltaproteobacteria bacterium]
MNASRFRQILPAVVYVTLGALLLLFTPTIGSARDLDPLVVKSELPAGVVTLKTLARTDDPVVVRGNDLPGMLGRPAFGIRAYALREGALAIIPSQADEFDDKGRIISTNGNNPSKDEDDGKLDSNDELVVMASDLGAKASRALFPRTARAAAEIEAIDPLTGEKGWFYLFDFDDPPEASTVSYVHYDPAEDLVDSSLYRVDFNPEHAILIDDMRLKSSSGDEGPNLIDRIKARTVLKSRLYLTFHFNEEDITTKVAAYKIGPIRVVRATEYYLKILFLKVTPSAYVDYLFYSNAIVGPSEMKIPFNPKLVLRGGSESWSGLDFDSNVYGWSFYTEGHPEPVVLNGSKMKGVGETREGVRWFALYGENAGTLLRIVYGPTLVDAKLPYVFFYRDDATRDDAPEREKGETLLGYYMDIQRIPKGEHKFWFYQYFAAPYKPGDEKKFNDIVDHPLEVKAQAMSLPKTAAMMSQR